VCHQGVLLLGDSGAGKSDLALQLLDRGHELIADDAVDVSIRQGRLVGACPEQLIGLLEPRGLGIIRVGSDRPGACLIDLIIRLTHPAADQWASWPRLLPARSRVSIAGRMHDAVCLPVAPGRPLALLVERLTSQSDSPFREANDHEHA